MKYLESDVMWYKQQNLRLPVSIWKIISTCYYRNKGEVENMQCDRVFLHWNVLTFSTCFKLGFSEYCETNFNISLVLRPSCTCKKEGLVS